MENTREVTVLLHEVVLQTERGVYDRQRQGVIILTARSAYEYYVGSSSMSNTNYVRVFGGLVKTVLLKPRTLGRGLVVL